MKRSITVILTFFFILPALLSACQNPLTAQQIWDRSFDTMLNLSTFQTTASVLFSVEGEEQTMELQGQGSHDPSGKSYLQLSVHDVADSTRTMYVLQNDQDEFYAGSMQSDGISWWLGPLDYHDFSASGGSWYMQIISPATEKVRAIWTVPSLLEDEVINGVTCYHITLRLVPESFLELLYDFEGLDAQEIVEMNIRGTADYWVSKSDLQFNRSETVFQFLTSANTTATITTSIEYFNFNEPVTFPVP